MSSAISMIITTTKLSYCHNAVIIIIVVVVVFVIVTRSVLRIEKEVVV